MTVYPILQHQRRFFIIIGTDVWVCAVLVYDTVDLGVSCVIIYLYFLFSQGCYFKNNGGGVIQWSCDRKIDQSEKTLFIPHIASLKTLMCNGFLNFYFRIVYLNCLACLTITSMVQCLCHHQFYSKSGHRGSHIS